MHLLYHPLLLLTLLICIVAGTLSPVTAAVPPATGEGTVLYSTDFTQAEGWVTNSNDRFYPENATGRYHYLIEGGTGSYSAYALPEKVNGPFVLEFDVTPTKTDNSATFRFGIGTADKDSQKGPLIMVELANKKDGKLFYLKTVSKENALHLVGSSPSTGDGGSTIRYEDNKTYQVKVTYYATDNRASLVVKEAGSPDILFTTSAPVSGKIEDLNYIFLTALGDGVPGPQAEGYIDNIRLTLPESQAAVNPTDTETPVVTAAPTLDTGSLTLTPEPTPVYTVAPSHTLFPSPPTPTPTPKSGSFPFFLIPALGGGALIALRRRKDE